MRAQEVLNLLESEPPHSLATSEVAVRRLDYQGIAYRILQDFPRSEATLAHAEELASSSQPELLSDVLNARGALEFDEQRYEAAEITLHHALDSARQYHLSRQQLAALGNLVRLTIVNQRYSEAIDQSLAALDIARAADMKSIEATLLGNLGWCYFQLGDFENALDYFRQAQEASSRINITGSSFYWQGTVAQSYQELHEYEKARQLFEQTLDNATRTNNKQLMGETLNALVRLDLMSGRWKQAKEYNDRALQLQSGGQDPADGAETRMLAGRLATIDGNFAVASKFLTDVVEHPGKPDSLKWEALAGLAGVYNAQTSYSSADEQYRKSIAAFEQVRSAIERDDLRICFLARGIESYEAYIDFLLRQNRALDALRIADQSRSRTLAEGLKSGGRPGSDTQPFRPQALAKKLNATLLVYWMGEQHSYLWAIAPASIKYFVLPAAQEVEPMLKSYREALFQSRDPLQTGNADALKLYSILVQPAEKFIPKGSRVIVLPDGDLYGLNFETLIAPDPEPHYWIEDVTLTTANSLSLLASATARVAPRDKTLFLVGNTVSPSADFPALPQAGDEMQDVEKYFPPARRAVLTGAQGTPTAYLTSQPERFSYMHFVTHGTASRARPLESAVILSKEKDADSFKLYARDIVKRRLSAYLVVISACNGAGTRAYSGEGLVGLSWAFLRAGAHNVIGALWEVSDSSTPQLMDKLYDGLSHGQDPATALRAAKLSLLHSGTVYKKPFYWAPFQLYAGS